MHKFFITILLVLLGLVNGPASQAASDINYRLPMNCQELLPDYSAFLGFLESIAKTQATEKPAFSKRLFTMLALSKKTSEVTGSPDNPVAETIRRSLCYFREQKARLREVAYNDPEIIEFLLKSISEMEVNAKSLIVQLEQLRAQRDQFERQFAKSEVKSRKIEQEASKEALKKYEALSRKARAKL